VIINTSRPLKMDAVTNLYTAKFLKCYAKITDFKCILLSDLRVCVVT